MINTFIQPSICTKSDTIEISVFPSILSYKGNESMSNLVHLEG